MRMLLCLLLLVTLESPGARAGTLEANGRDAQGSPSGNWSAKSRAGLTLNGTWTAAVDPKTGAVTGTWTLNDASARTLSRGAWSAAKSPKGWSGAWRSVVSGNKAEFAGTWSADIDLKPNAPLADLFAQAAKAAVSGSWEAGRHSGGWSIRAASQR
ncbi:MAG: hypothetical protein M3468_02315 [Acidobacteriota bacterium]|nr:hypothetical protein [Acidobacteriota bacterium]